MASSFSAKLTACMAFPADLSERRQQNEVRRSKCADQNAHWNCIVGRYLWGFCHGKLALVKIK
jgi:hypothetical protein